MNAVGSLFGGVPRLLARCGKQPPRVPNCSYSWAREMAGAFVALSIVLGLGAARFEYGCIRFSERRAGWYRPVGFKVRWVVESVGAHWAARGRWGGVAGLDKLVFLSMVL